MTNVRISALLLLAIAGKTFLESPSGGERLLAEQWLIPSQIRQVQLSDSPAASAYVDDSRAVLFFTRDGMQGPIDGVMVIENERIRDLTILGSHDGIHKRELDLPKFCSQFIGRPAKSPQVADALSGATITSQAITDEVNVRLRLWEKHVQPPPTASSQNCQRE